MNSIIAVFFLIAILSLCNLSEKSKPTANSDSANANSSETQKPSTTSDHGSQNSSSSSAPATDRVAVTLEVMKIEKDLTTGSFAGHISTLTSFISDDHLS